MEMKKIKRLAANVFDVGVDRVWINPDEMEKISEAMTKEDVRGLIAEGLIKKKKMQAQSRGRARVLLVKKQAGRKSGKGKRKGTKKTRIDPKSKWMGTVRAQRRTLKEMKNENPELFENLRYSNVYNKIKGGFFKGKNYVRNFVEQQGKK